LKVDEGTAVLSSQIAEAGVVLLRLSVLAALQVFINHSRRENYNLRTIEALLNFAAGEWEDEDGEE
jgi:hypothetical protein